MNGRYLPQIPRERAIGTLTQLHSDFAIVDVHPDQLAAKQRIPHVDPVPIFGLIYLNREDRGGTLFFKRSTDPYLRDRLHDLEDLGHRLMRQLVGQDHAPSREQLPENAILIARAMGSVALLDYDRKRLRGLVLEEGTANSHVSIVARALGIPAVGEVPNAPGIADPGDAIIVDGTSGSIYVRPSAEIELAYAERVRFRARRQAQYAALRDRPCVTKDGQPVELMINAGLVIDLPHIDDTGSAGIGLFRTELQFMVGQSLPRSSATSWRSIARCWMPPAPSP